MFDENIVSPRNQQANFRQAIKILIVFSDFFVLSARMICFDCARDCFKTKPAYVINALSSWEKLNNFTSTTLTRFGFLE